MVAEFFFELAQKLLFQLDAEVAHRVAIQSLNWAEKLRLVSAKVSAQPVQCLGLTFPNRIGLAAGFDKNAECVAALHALGFGFVEIGTVTPRPQIGNAKPRLFRLESDEAIINRLGFNNHGAKIVRQRLQKLLTSNIVGINIGKNRDTKNADALHDYVLCMQELWPYASYFTINVSSPNTAGLRELQQKHYLLQLLQGVKEEQLRIAHHHQKTIPLLLKIAPDLSEQEIAEVTAAVQNAQFDGMIVSNTTITRPNLRSSLKNETGGLSGRPLSKLNTQIVQCVRKHLPVTIPIIATGGIMDAASAEEKLAAGATLLQIYTGFIYRGVRLLNELKRL